MLASELAGLTGLSEAMISRIASDERQPSIETMQKIRWALGWSVERQVDALSKGEYAYEFRHRLERRRSGLGPEAPPVR